MIELNYHKSLEHLHVGCLADNILRSNRRACHRSGNAGNPDDGILCTDKQGSAQAKDQAEGQQQADQSFHNTISLSYFCGKGVAAVLKLIVAPYKREINKNPTKTTRKFTKKRQKAASPGDRFLFS